MYQYINKQNELQVSHFSPIFKEIKGPLTASVRLIDTCSQTFIK